MGRVRRLNRLTGHCHTVSFASLTLFNDKLPIYQFVHVMVRVYVLIESREVLSSVHRSGGFVLVLCLALVLIRRYPLEHEGDGSSCREKGIGLSEGIWSFARTMSL